MIVEDMLFALLIGMVITLGITLYRIQKIVDRMLDRSSKIRIRMERVFDNFDEMLNIINKINGEDTRSKQQKDYEEKMIDMFIDELNKKHKEDNK